MSMGNVICHCMALAEGLVDNESRKSRGKAGEQYLCYGLFMRNARNAQTSVVNICFR